MKRFWGMLVWCMYVVKPLWAQSIIQQYQAQRYIPHEVMPGETWYRLGQIYQLHPDLIARANGMTVDSVLRLHTTIKIPLLPENFIQPHQIPAQGYQPVFHQVMPGETLYHISTLYKPATVEDLRLWNHLTDNAIRSGQLLVVGYMRFNSKALPLSFASSHVAVAPATPSSVPQSASPAMADSALMFRALHPKAAENGHIPPPLPEKQPQIAIQPSAALATQPNPERKDTSREHTLSEAAFSTSASALSHTQETAEISPFLQEYEQQAHQPGWKQAEIRGAGGWFSSNIPPSSRKYYVLFNAAPRGQIIQITNPLNGKSIYAKVLDGIPKLGENANLIVKISDAAQKDLGTMQDKFFCIVHYFETENK